MSGSMWDKKNYKTPIDQTAKDTPSTAAASAGSASSSSAVHHKDDKENYDKQLEQLASDYKKVEATRKEFDAKLREYDYEYTKREPSPEDKSIESILNLYRMSGRSDIRPEHLPILNKHLVSHGKHRIPYDIYSDGNKVFEYTRFSDEVRDIWDEKRKAFIDAQPGAKECRESLEKIDAELAKINLEYQLIYTKKQEADTKAARFKAEQELKHKEKEAADIQILSEKRLADAVHKVFADAKVDPVKTIHSLSAILPAFMEKMDTDLQKALKATGLKIDAKTSTVVTTNNSPYMSLHDFQQHAPSNLSKQLFDYQVMLHLQHLLTSPQSTADDKLSKFITACEKFKNTLDTIYATEGFFFKSQVQFSKKITDEFKKSNIPNDFSTQIKHILESPPGGAPLP